MGRVVAKRLQLQSLFPDSFPMNLVIETQRHTDTTHEPATGEYCAIHTMDGTINCHTQEGKSKKYGQKYVYSHFINVAQNASSSRVKMSGVFIQAEASPTRPCGCAKAHCPAMKLARGPTTRGV